MVSHPLVGHKRKFQEAYNAQQLQQQQQQQQQQQTSSGEQGVQGSASMPRSPSMSTSNALHEFPNKKIRSSFELMNGTAATPSPSASPQVSSASPVSSQPRTPTTPVTPSNAFATHSQQQQHRVVQEQKKRLALKVKKQTRKIDSLQKNVNQMQEERTLRENILSVIYRNWSAMLQDMELVEKRLPATTTTTTMTTTTATPSEVTPNVNGGETSTSSLDSGKTFLEQLLALYADILSNRGKTSADGTSAVVDEIQKQVTSGCQRAMQILHNVVSGVQAEKSRNDDLMKQINEDAGFKKREQTLMLIKDDNKKVRSENETLQKALDDIQIRYRTLHASHCTATEEYARLQRDAAQKKDNVEDLQEELDNSNKLTQKLQISLEELKNTQNEAASQQQQQDTQSQSQSMFSDEDTQKIIGNFTDEIQQLRTTLQMRDADMERLLHQMSQIEQAKQQLDREKMDEQFVRGTVVFKSLQELFDITNVSYIQETKKVQMLEQRVKAFGEERERLKKDLSDMYDQRLKAIAGDLETANTTLGSLRRENENLQSNMQLREREPAELHARLEHLNTDKTKLESRVQEQEKDIELYKTDKEELVKRIKNLLNGLRRQKNELDAKERELQEKKQRLKAHESNSSRRSAQDKTLQDLKGSEAELKAKVSVLESDVARYKATTDGSLREELESQREECSALSAALDDLGTHCNELEEENENLRQKISNLEQSNTDLIREKIMQQHIESKLRTEKEQLEKSEIEKTAMETVTAEAITALQSKLEFNAQEIAAAKKENAELRSIIEWQKHEIIVKTQQRESNEQELAKQQSSLQLAIDQQTKSMEERDRMEMNFKKMESERDLLQRKLKKMQSAGGAGSSVVEEELRENLDYFKDMVTCSVCSSRRKNRIISRCFHMFCEQCVQDTLQARNRKCPTCKTSFGKNDIQEIYF